MKKKPSITKSTLSAPQLTIAPSLLSADFGRLAQEIRDAEEAGADLFHLDIMDGHFVPNLTFGLPVIQAIRKATALPLDAHLMVSNPDDYIERFAEAGVDYFSFHFETVHHPHRLLQKIKSHKMKAGIALNPGTFAPIAVDLLPDVDFMVVMSVNPGFSGQEFIPQTLRKIDYFRKVRDDFKLNFKIEIDGGINEETCKLAREVGADMIVAGSYIFGQNNYFDAIRRLKNV